jgi:hypothetical protein
VVLCLRWSRGDLQLSPLLGLLSQPQTSRGLFAYRRAGTRRDAPGRAATSRDEPYSAVIETTSGPGAALAISSARLQHVR